MTRYEKLKDRTIEQLAIDLIQDGETKFCKGDCEGCLNSEEIEGCPHPEICCIRWLNEEV